MSSGRLGDNWELFFYFLLVFIFFFFFFFGRGGRGGRRSIGKGIMGGEGNHLIVVTV